MNTHSRHTEEFKTGFWKHIKSHNIITVFATDTDELQTAASIVMAEYDRLLGPEFIKCQHTMQASLGNGLVRGFSADVR